MNEPLAQAMLQAASIIFLPALVAGIVLVVIGLCIASIQAQQRRKAATALWQPTKKNSLR